MTVACTTPSPDEALPPYLRLAGPVDATVAADGTRTRAAIAWVWVVDGRLGAEVQTVPLEPRLTGYVLEVDGPPTPWGGQPAPEGLAAAPPLAWGVPLLVEPTAGAPLFLRADAPALLDWVAGLGPRDGTVWVEPPSAGAVVAYPPGALLAAMGAEGASRLVDTGWATGGPWCAFDEVVAGLTLYETGEAPCATWRPLAAPGEHTEFQGLRMVPW